MGTKLTEQYRDRRVGGTMLSVAVLLAAASRGLCVAVSGYPLVHEVGARPTR